MPSTAFHINDKQTAMLSLVARLMLGFLFLYSGWGKLMAPEATIAYIANAGLPLPMLGYAVALVVELLVAAAFVVGYQLRWSALILCVFSVASALAFHSNFAEKMHLLQFMKNIAIGGGFLQLALLTPSTKGKVS